MADTTNISWCDKTWSPWIGCQRISPGCDGCYAAHLMDTRMGRVEWGERGAGEGTRSHTSDSYWKKPTVWDRDARVSGVRQFIFPSLCDPFDTAVAKTWRWRFFKLIEDTPNLVWLLLTKRIGNVIKMTDPLRGERCLPRNAAIGATFVNQEEWDRDSRKLAHAEEYCDPLFTFASFEPLLGPINMGDDWKPSWVITGGETDQGTHKARPSNPQWFRDIRDQCAAERILYHHKQHGEWASYEQIGASGWTFSGHSLKDGTQQGFLTSGKAGKQKPMYGGRSFETRYPWPDTHENPCMVKVGKNIAGRTLDRRKHEDRPQV